MVSNECESCKTCRASASCVGSALSLLDTMGESERARKEKLRLAAVGKMLAGAPQQFGAGKYRVALDECQEERLKSLPEAVASMVRQLQVKGWFEFARREMMQGRNPAGSSRRDAWMRLLCRELVAGGTTRKALCMAYMQELGMTPGSAKVRVSKAVSVFLAGGLLREISGRLVFVQAPSENHMGI